MAMSPDVEREYQNAIRQVVLKHGTPISLPGQGRWGWQDFEAGNHLWQCGGRSDREVAEDDWYEFVSMGGPGDGHTHGVSLPGVSCNCGHLTDRTVRWQAHPSEIAEAVFEQAFGSR